MKDTITIGENASVRRVILLLMILNLQIIPVIQQDMLFFFILFY